MFRPVIFISVLCVTLLTSLVRPTFAQTCTPTPQDRDIWNSIKDSDNPRTFLAYLQQFPMGCYRNVANFNIKSHLQNSRNSKFSNKMLCFFELQKQYGVPSLVKNMDFASGS
jgi:hypothetical protein